MSEERKKSHNKYAKYTHKKTKQTQLKVVQSGGRLGGVTGEHYAGA